MSVNVNRVVMPLCPNLEIILAYYLIRFYGQEQFPGITQAYLQFNKEEIGGDDNYYDATKILPVGRGQGRFGSEDTLQKVVQYLSLWKKPELSKILAEVYSTRGKHSPTMLAELVKVCYRAKCNNIDVINWTICMIDAIIAQEMTRVVASDGEISPFDIITEQIGTLGLGENPKVRQTLFDYIQKSADRSRNGSITELDHVISCLSRKGYNRDQINAWLKFVLVSLDRDQVEFQTQIDIIRDIKPIVVVTQIHDTNKYRNLKMRVIRSDSLQAQRAARYIGTDVILIVKSTGNCQIFVDNRIKPKLSLANAAKMIRWLELPVDGKSVDWHKLGCDGNYPGIEHWFYSSKDEIILNGSETFDATPTEICIPAFIDALQHAFGYALIRDWCNRRNIRMNGDRAKEHLQPALVA